MDTVFSSININPVDEAVSISRSLGVAPSIKINPDWPLIGLECDEEQIAEEIQVDHDINQY